MQTFTRFISVIVPLISFSCFSALAANSGVIHFRGEIVDPPCDYQPSSTKMSVSCYRDGGNHVQVVPIKTLIRGQQIVNEKSTARLQWVNKKENAAVLIVEYK